MARNQSAEIYFASFSPDPSDILVNRLFSLSLFISLLGSFGAVLGRYWLTNYQGKGGKREERESWNHLRRSLSAARWQLVGVLEQALPLTLMMALAVFSFGFVIHLADLDLVTGALTVLSLGVMVGALLAGFYFRVLDPFCPYRTPLEEPILFLGHYTFKLLSFMMDGVTKLAKQVARICNWLGRHIPATFNGMQPSRARASQEDSGESNSCHIELNQLINTQTGGTNGCIQLQMQPENLGDGTPPVSLPVDTHLPQEQPTGFFSRAIPKAMLQISKLASSELRSSWDLHGHAISRALIESEDSCTLYQAAASLCNISRRSALEIVIYDQASRNRLMRLLHNAIRDLDRSQKQGPMFKEIREVEMAVVVFGTATLHLYLSTENVENLPNGDSIIATSSRQPLTGPLRRSRKEKYGELKGILQLHWHLQNDKFGRQPPVFTSTSLAAGLLMGCLDSNESVFHQESESLTYRLDSVSSEDPGSWNQLALLAMACNTRGGRTMSEKRQEGFKAIQDAYNT